MAHAPDLKRTDVPAADCWDLSPLFTSREGWETLYKTLEEKLPEYERFKGRIAETFEDFRESIVFDHAIARDLEKLYTYAHLMNDQDKTDTAADELYQRAVNLYTRIADVSSFIVPEIQALSQETLADYRNRDEMAEYRFYLDKLIRKIPHTRNAAEEQLLAMAGESLGAPRQIFGQLDNADLNFGELTNEKGETLPLTHGNFVSFLTKKDRKLRESAFRQYYKVYDAHKHSISATLAASVKKDLFLARARRFDTARQAALFTDDVAPAVYDNLIQSVKAGLDPLYRYLDFRKKALGLTDLHVYDTYIPVVPDVDFHMDYDEAVATCLEALRPLGEDYCRILKKGLTTGGWVDRYENKGKRSGAYSSGCYDSPPYILLNYDGNTINSLFTLIHEAGHSMHSYYSKEAQPYTSHNYTIFVAEVASTLNETLLGRHLLKKYADDPKMKAYILNREIDNIRGTFFRQTMFAEFEHIIHGLAADNQALTLDTFTSTYTDLLKTYFGDRMILDDELALECLRIPHFYSAFYVYKYATGLAAALAIAGRITEKGQDAVDDYLAFLKLGGSMFPIDELKIAGVDMASPDAVNATVTHFERRVSDLESVWTSI
ncbi:MAG: oligoendopeptidase F [Desulfobacterales bacterium]|nr:oligoendopeptidase F [Desulfobacterales bacterium]